MSGAVAPEKVSVGKKSALLFGVSALALVMGQRSAWADCTPDPVANNGTVTCSGTSPNGFQTASANVHIIVDAGANVTPGASSQAAVQLNNDSSTATIDVAGTVDGQTLYGLLAQGSGSHVNVTVSGTGVIQGAEGIFSSLPGGGTIPSLNIDNSGQIAGTTGWAVDLGVGSIGTLTNHAGATISGGVTTYSLGQATNNGVIDGGSHPALYVGSYSSTVTNTGTLRSSATGTGPLSGPLPGAISTLYVQQGSVTNSGRIEALGTGPAISAYTALSVSNQAGGVISAAQGAAIQGGYAYNSVTNAGLITGNVMLQGTWFGDSFIQQGGTVQGNVTFGGANDFYIIDLAHGSAVGVTGTIDGGGGTNSFGVVTAADASFMPLAMPNFQQFYAAVTSPQATLTLTPTPAPFSQTLDLTGNGTIVNNADVSTTDVQAMMLGSNGQQLTVQNTATLTTVRANSLSTTLSVVRMGETSLTNTGTIRGEGNGVSAISTFWFGNKIINSGKIISDQGITILTEPFYSYPQTNITNHSDGLISSGSGTAIQGNAVVDNAGAITGSVNLINGSSTYIAEATGILQGNLNFSGDSNVFKVDYSLLNTGRGVTGVINPGSGTRNLLAVLTSGAQNLSLPDLGGFDRFGIETRDSATTTTFGTSADTIGREIEIFGPGTVVNQANLLISVAFGHYDNAAVKVFNSGTTQGSTFINQASIDVSWGYGIRSQGLETIENTGVISVSNGATGIESGWNYNNLSGSVINSGTITGVDASSTGVRLSGLSALHNQGIVQAAGNAVSLSYGGIVQNSGSITSGTTAIMGATYSSSVVIRNEAGGTISGTDYAIQCVGCSSLIYNAGTINGAVNLRYGNNIYVDAGGTLTGATDFEFAHNTFLIQQNTGASIADLSNFDTAHSNNTIGWAISGAGTVDLTPVAGFTSFAVGTMTPGSTATIAPGTQNLSAPVQLLGTGTVINQANLSNAAGFALQSSSYSAGIVNQGAITGQNGVAAFYGARNLENDQSIVTSGTAIRLDDSYAVTPNDETPWSTINNNGTITVASGQFQAAILVASNYGPYYSYNVDLSAGISTVPAISQPASPPADYTLVQINNSGTIRTSGDLSHGIEAINRPHLRVANSGNILTTGTDANGIWLTSDGGSINNSGRIETQGANAPAVWESYGSSPDLSSALTLVNSGTITASGGGVQYVDTAQQSQYINGNWVWVTLPSVTNTVAAPTIRFDHGTIVNAATGVISASGLASIALHLTDYSTEKVTVNNAGVITGTGGGTYPVATNQPGVQGQVTLPGAILGGAGVEIINNAGLIAGGVDLGAGDDSVVWQQGGRFQGRVDGGAGANSLTVQASNARIDATDPFVNFQTTMIASGAALDVAAGNTFTTGSMQIAAGGTLSGGGTIVGNIDDFGTISAGDNTLATAAIHPAAATPPTLTINGNVTFEAGSTLSLQVQGGQTSLLAVNGNAVINGGTLQFVVDNASPVSFNLPVLTTTGTLTGAFTRIVANGFMTATPVVTANGLSFDFLRQIGPGLTFAPQPQRVVNYFNGLFRAGVQGGAVDTVIGFSALPSGQLDGVFAQLHPEAYGSALELGLRQSLAVSDAFEMGLDTAARIEGQGWSLWTQGLGAFATRDADAALGTAKFSIDNYGMLAGLDYTWGKGFRAGLMAGYSDGSQSFTGLAADTKAHGYVIGGYGAYRHDNWALTSLIAYNGQTAKTHRQIAVTGAMASGGYDLNSLIARGKAAYVFNLRGALQLMPAAGLTFVQVKRNTAIEQGAGSLDLVVDGDRHDTLVSDLGLKLTNMNHLSGGKTLIPEVSVGWRHYLIDDGVSVTAHFTGLEGQPPLVVRAPGSSRDQAVLSAGATLLVTERLSLSARYQGEFGGGLTSNSVNLGASLHF